MSINDPQLIEAFEIFDSIHQKDPNQKIVGGQHVSCSVLYHHKLSEWLDRIVNNPSVPLRLAARSQHIQRWLIPRSTYPMNKSGYRKWRTRLNQFHAKTAADVLRQLNYDEYTVSRVQQILRKERLKIDSEVQHLEDAICLVFLELQLEEFSKQHPKEKLVNILRKTWNKMSSLGHQLALKLNLSDNLQNLLKEAISKP